MILIRIIFVDGITEDIIANLSLWRTFPVISRNSSFAYKDQTINIKEVAAELGANYIVQGNVRKGGQKNTYNGTVNRYRN